MPLTNPDYSDLNHEEMAKSIGLKAKHIPMLVGSFLEETAPILVNLENAIKAKDYETIKTAAHSIKGSAGNLRFNELSEMARELEHAGTDLNTTFEYDAYYEAVKNAVSTIKL